MKAWQASNHWLEAKHWTKAKALLKELWEVNEDAKSRELLRQLNALNNDAHGAWWQVTTLMRDDLEKTSEERDKYRSFAKQAFQALDAPTT